MGKEKLSKIIYFDKETIKNILQEKYKGTKVITSGTTTDAETAIDLSAEATAKTDIGVPFFARLKFAVSGKLDAKYLLKYDRTTTITSTEISDFESIKDSFEEFKHVQVDDIENSSTFFRVAGGYLKMMGNNIEGVNVKEFKAAMDSFEGYDVYKINSSTYVRFNNVAFVSNYKRNDLLTTKLKLYCVPVGQFKADDFDFMRQLERMQTLLNTTATTTKSLADIYPPQETEMPQIKNDASTKNVSDKPTIKLYDVVYACVSLGSEVVE